jgi:hypothetical protein
MAVFADSGRGRLTEAEPIGLLTEGAAGIAVIVLAIIAISGVSVEILASIATIVIGAGLMVQGFNSAAEHAKAVPAAAGAEPTSDVMVDFVAGVTGIVLGILALIGVNAAHLVPAALIVFGASLLLSGTLSFGERGTAAAGGAEVLTGLAAVVLGILSLVLPDFWMLVLVGFIAVGATMLMVSASFSGAMSRLLTSA